jgi:hypothetical protein
VALMIPAPVYYRIWLLPPLVVSPTLVPLFRYCMLYSVLSVVLGYLETTAQILLPFLVSEWLREPMSILP